MAPVEPEPEVQVSWSLAIWSLNINDSCWVWFLFILMLGFQLFQVLPEPASPTPMETSGCEPADLCQAFSDVILHTAIRDVDADDYENPMLCSEYVKDIYKYLRQLEVSNMFKLIFSCYIYPLWIFNPFSCHLRLSRTSDPLICRARRLLETCGPFSLTGLYRWTSSSVSCRRLCTWLWESLTAFFRWVTLLIS